MQSQPQNVVLVTLISVMVDIVLTDVSLFWLICRMTTLWQASLCWATLSPSHRSQKTSTRITSSNSTSSLTSTTSDQRASTPLRGGCTVIETNAEMQLVTMCFNLNHPFIFFNPTLWSYIRLLRRLINSLNLFNVQNDSTAWCWLFKLSPFLQ